MIVEQQVSWGTSWNAAESDSHPRDAGPTPPVPQPTLLWIGLTTTSGQPLNGHPTHPELDPVIAYCHQVCGAVAIRPSLQSAIDRPAPGTQRVLIVRRNRTPVSAERVDQIVRMYDRAELAWLCTSLCEGEGRTGIGPSCDLATHRLTRFTTARWHQQLPGWLGDAASPYRQPQDPVAGSTAVITRRYDAVESLLEWLTTIDAPFVCLRPEEQHRAGNFDTILWDDSAGRPFRSMAASRNIRHRKSPPRIAYLTTHVDWPACQPMESETGSVTVFRKPWALSGLLDWLGKN